MSGRVEFSARPDLFKVVRVRELQQQIPPLRCGMTSKKTKAKGNSKYKAPSTRSARSG
jgi:hypothetical protein